jgi:hypothetical protein
MKAAARTAFGCIDEKNHLALKAGKEAVAENAKISVLPTTDLKLKQRMLERSYDTCIIGSEHYKSI